MSDGGCRFELNDLECKKTIEETIIAWLHETAGEIVSQAVRNTPVGKVDGGNLKRSWRYEVEEDEFSATIGSPLENAIWNEFGTGEFALEGKGRKGGWWVRVGNGENEMRPEVAEAYEWPKVRRKMGKIVKVFTYGKRPQRTLFNAFEKVHKGAAKELAKKLDNARTEWKPNKIVGEKDLGHIEIKIGK